LVNSDHGEFCANSLWDSHFSRNKEEN